MYYTYNYLGQFSGTSDVSCERCIDIAPKELIPEYNWNGYSWVYAPDVGPLKINLGLPGIVFSEPESDPVTPE